MANYTYRGYRDGDTIYVEIKNNNEIIGTKSFIGNYEGGIEGAVKNTRFEGDNFGFYFNGIIYDKQEVTPIVPTTPPTDGKSYIILNNGILITLTKQGPKKTAIAKDTQGNIIYTGAPSFTADDKTLLEEATLAISQNQSLSDIQTEFIQPPPTVEPNPTPQQINDNRQQDESKKSEQQEVVDAQQVNGQVVDDNTSPNLKLKGKEKFSLIIAQKGDEVKRILIPIVIGLATTAGMKAIGTALEEMSNFCLPEDEVKKILDVRNQVVDKLNNISSIINSISKTADGLNNILTITSTTVNTLNNSITALELSIPALPTPTPGIPSPGVIALNVKSILEKTLAKTTPKITTASTTISAIDLSLSVTNKILLKVITLLNSLDIYLKKCGSNLLTTTPLTPLNDSLLTLERISAQVAISPSKISTYKGFTLEIVTEVYSPTVNRVKAVAKNAQGIILLQTPLSFTTTPQVLIEEIKLIIDSNNLKAN